MSPTIIEALSIYITMEQKLSEDEFRKLAQKAKTQGWLNQLHQEVSERVQAYTTSRDIYVKNKEPQQAIEQQKLLIQVERQLAFLEYLQFAR